MREALLVAGACCFAVAVAIERLQKARAWRDEEISARRNWAGNVKFKAKQVARPKSLQELSKIVKELESVKVIGTGHCFNDIADTLGKEGVQISMENFKGIEEMEDGVFCVEAGVTWAELIEHVRRCGRGLVNAPSLPHINCVGSIVTGTHGTGWDFGILATMIRGFEIMLADGTVQVIDEGNTKYSVALLNLGALGIVTKIKFQTVEDFDVYKVIYMSLPIENVLKFGLGQILSSADYVSIFLDWRNPYCSSLWQGFMMPSARLPPPATYCGALLTKTEKVHPITGFDPSNCISVGHGSWSEKIYHFLPHLTPSAGSKMELQSEIFVKLELADEAFRILFDNRSEFNNVLWISEIRVIKGDHFPLSPCFIGDDYSSGSSAVLSDRFVAFHFTWNFDVNGVVRAIHHVEVLLDKLGAKPHFGKLFTRISGSSHKGLKVLRDLKKEFDPSGKFSNSYLNRAFREASIS